MSYLEKLIERATDTTLDLENNRIGNYEITPQHGNVAVYHIYKYGATYLPTGRKYPYYDKTHVCTITIGFNRVDIEVDKDYLRPKEISNIIDVINNIYDTFDVNTKSI